MTCNYIQFGCGTSAAPSWRNFDIGPSFWLQKRFPFLKSSLVKRGFPDYPVSAIEVGDVTKGLPVRQRSAKAVYCSHVLEHLTLEEFRIAVRNVYSYLREDGLFRMVVPDLEHLTSAYLADQSSEAAFRFMNDACLGEERLPRGLRALPRAVFGRTRHLWMWDYKGLSKELAEAGFTHIRRAQMGDSVEPRFVDVEDAGRWENCLGVECRKPVESQLEQQRER
jgi:predicted SAM-dependent methyltransferase